MGLLKLGKVSLDGTKIKANASKHHALSWDYACKLEQQLQDEVDELIGLAEKADSDEIPDGMDLPEELSRRQERLSAIADAKEKMEQRAAERYAAEQKAYEKKVKEREAKEKKSGKKPRGRDPKPPEPGPRKKDQVNLTDEESRIMPSSDKGFEQAYNAQASVDIDSMLIVASHITQASNDKQEMKPTISALNNLPGTLGTVEKLLADAGYFSHDNVVTCEESNIEPYISPGRESHNQPLYDRFLQPEKPLKNTDSVGMMKYRLKTIEGRELYSKRKSTVEPVFGIIKNIMGFRQFLLRGFEAVSGEWTLVSIAWNIKRMFSLTG